MIPQSPAAKGRRFATAGRLPALVRRSVSIAYGAAPRLLVVSAVLSVAGALISGGQVLLGKQALTDLIRVNDGRATIIAAMSPFLAMAALAAVGGVISTVSGQLGRLLGERVQKAVMTEVIEVGVSVDLEAFEDPRFFDHQQRVIQNAVARPLEVTQGLISMLRGLLGAIGLTAVLLTLAPVLVPLLLLVSLPLVIASRRGSRLEYGFILEQMEQLRKRYYLQEVLSARPGAKEVRAFGLATEMLARWGGLWNQYLDALKIQVRRRMVLAIFGRLGATGLGLVALFFLVYLIAHHKVSLAAAGAAAMAMLLLSSRVETVANGGGGLYESSLFLDDLDRFIEMGNTHREARSAIIAPPGFSELRTENLRFRYPGTGATVLDGINLTINQGEIIALVGENGSGKTTLAKLLADLYKPTGGRILWDGRDIAAMDPMSVRESVAVIFQDWQMYALPAAQNIGVGRPEAINDLQRIIDAAKRSGAHDFLSKLPQGYDNYLSKVFDGGVDLSIGQWQRVAIARAFFRDAPFVVLDEPSSALDPRAEHELFSSIRTLLAGRTVLLISHRFSSVRSADRILVMEHGQIVENGSHEELMYLDGLYSELFNLQAESYLETQEH
jgi:ATP-binding cassette subfamily B protein